MSGAPAKDSQRRKLRSGFSTGTAMTAAAMAALQHLLTGKPPELVSVHLPGGLFLPVNVHQSRLLSDGAQASVIKDGGDDPDVTHKAEVRVSLKCFAYAPRKEVNGICVIGGTGVGRVTKPGLPAPVGEPAINPTPREMLARNLSEEIMRLGGIPEDCATKNGLWSKPDKPFFVVPFQSECHHADGVVMEVLVEVPKGEELARRTLNPRLGIIGGISILGTTGIVKPFSHEAYEETIQAALSVAASNGCSQVVLSTGGKSEHYARNMLPRLPMESFIQIADFFSFAVKEVQNRGFAEIIHSVFFGKAVKMAQGHPYTHAHKVHLDLAPVAKIAEEQGHDAGFCGELAEANTARHALELLTARGATGVIHAIAGQAMEQSLSLTEGRLRVRLLLFDHGGNLLADVRSH